MEKRYCKKCLLKDMDKDEYFKNIYDYISNIDEELKVDDSEYERRLSVCKECDNLLDGMCRKCGCYVELRAAMKKNYCPDVHKHWIAIT